MKSTLLVFFSTLQLTVVYSRNVNLEVSLGTYSNPTSEECDGGHCESPRSDDCDNYFRLQVISQSGRVLAGPINTNDIQSDSFSFTSSVRATLGISDPIVFSDIDFPSDGMRLEITVTDDDTFPNGDDHIDTISFNIASTTAIGTDISATMTGTCGMATISLTYRLVGNCDCVPMPRRFTCNTDCTKNCLGNFVGDDCDQCISTWYGSFCDVQCIAVPEQYTCNSDGSRNCQPNWYPAGVCGTNCVEEPERYTCNSDGSRNCQPNWYPAGVCDTQCVEQRYRYACNYRGIRICLSDWYPDGVCDFQCIPAPRRYNCNVDGSIICLGNFVGDECDRCRSTWYGSFCDTQCVEEPERYTCNSDGSRNCQPNWYPTGVCDTQCIPALRIYTCNQDGSKNCLGNFVGDECDRCSDTWYGSFCDVQCTPVSGRYTCNPDNGSRICLPNWYPAGVCDVQCTPVQGVYACNPNGTINCFVPNCNQITEPPECVGNDNLALSSPGCNADTQGDSEATRLYIGTAVGVLFGVIILLGTFGTIIYCTRTFKKKSTAADHSQSFDDPQWNGYELDKGSFENNEEPKE